MSKLFYIFCFVFVALETPVFSQPNMEKLLDNYDTPSSWANTPVSGSSQYTPNGGQTLRQEALRTMMNGSSGGSNAYSDWQEAENQARRAYNAEEKARYEKDKWRRKEDAKDAYYAAKAARNASDKVYYAAQKGDPTAEQYAEKARDAAERAKDDSEKARYYADTGE